MLVETHRIEFHNYHSHKVRDRAELVTCTIRLCYYCLLIVDREHGSALGRIDQWTAI